MTQSRRFIIADALWTAVQAAPEFAIGAAPKFRRNPRDPVNLTKDGPRVVWYEDELDGVVDEKGDNPMRRYSFRLGVVGRDEALADADHVAAVDALRTRAAALARDVDAGQEFPIAKKLREVSTVFKVEGLDAGGALILSSFEIEYRRGTPSRTS